MIRRFAAWWRRRNACPPRLAVEPVSVRCDRGRHRGDHGNAAERLTWSEVDGTFTVTITGGDPHRQITAATPKWANRATSNPIGDVKAWAEQGPDPSPLSERGEDFRQLLDRNMERHADLLALLARDGKPGTDVVVVDPYRCGRCGGRRDRAWDIPGPCPRCD